MEASFESCNEVLDIYIVLTIDRNTDKITYLLNLATSELKRSKIPKDKMTIRSTTLKSVLMFNKFISQYTSILNNLFSISLEFWLSNLFKRNSNSCNCLDDSKTNKIFHS